MRDFILMGIVASIIGLILVVADVLMKGWIIANLREVVCLLTFYVLFMWLGYISGTFGFGTIHQFCFATILGAPVLLALKITLFN